MKKHFILYLVVSLTLVFVGCNNKKINVEVISTTSEKSWVKGENAMIAEYSPVKGHDIEILPEQPQQVIDGFGGSFNEMGWAALTRLSENTRNSVMDSLFSETGCNFNLCRMPIGANDFALEWYSLNETAGDFEMENFNIERDKAGLIPYIKAAMQIKPGLKVWGSPWCPPSWMKKNQNYACEPTPYNQLDPSLPDRENGETDFITDEKTQKAYALYFSKYIEAYKEQGIDILAVHVQNEPHSCQPFPSCLWKGTDLKNFLRDYLSPTFGERSINTEIWYGTFERPYEDEWKLEIDSLLADTKAMEKITGFGFQWAGKNAIQTLNAKGTGKKLMHTEVECGDGKNTWEHAEYVYGLMHHYFMNGANSQMYWNMVLQGNQISRWGWEQNSMVTVNEESLEVKFNAEYYVMKHFSHFIKPGARVVKVNGNTNSIVCFKNPDGKLVLLVQNKAEGEISLKIKLENILVNVRLTGRSINTITLSDSTL